MTDFGTDSTESVDYPDVAQPVAREVAVGGAEAGVLVCGSGVGVCIVANKVHGVRAVNAHDAEEAELSRLHNDANVLCLSGRQLPEDAAFAIVDRWLDTQFEGGRHERRVQKIDEVESHNTDHAEQAI